jgi:hypothetical protein
MQVVEMDDVILDELGTFQQVTQNPSVVRDGDAEGILNCSHGADGVYGRSDPADALGKYPRVARVASGHDQLDTTEHHPSAPGIDNVPVLDLNLDAQVAFDARDWIDGDFLGRARCARRGRRRARRWRWRAGRHGLSTRSFYLFYYRQEYLFVLRRWFWH